MSFDLRHSYTQNIMFNTQAIPIFNVIHEHIPLNIHSAEEIVSKLSKELPCCCYFGSLHAFMFCDSCA